MALEKPYQLGLSEVQGRPVEFGWIQVNQTTNLGVRSSNLFGRTTTPLYDVSAPPGVRERRTIGSIVLTPRDVAMAVTGMTTTASLTSLKRIAVRGPHNAVWRSRSELPTTLADDSAMATAAMMGESRMPKIG